jgi:hypothetical protein
VDDVDRYRADARDMELEAFVEAHRGFYLVKRPLAQIIERDAKDDERPSFDTTRLSRELLRELQTSTQKRVQRLGELAPRWLVLPVRKRVDTFPDRISLGRSSYADIVLDVDFVSKLHAHIFVADDGTIDLVDRSVNGTRVDGHDLTQGDRVRLYVGCRVEIGPLELELFDAVSLYQALRADKG